MEGWGSGGGGMVVRTWSEEVGLRAMVFDGGWVAWCGVDVAAAIVAVGVVAVAVVVVVVDVVAVVVAIVAWTVA